MLPAGSLLSKLIHQIQYVLTFCRNRKGRKSSAGGIRSLFASTRPGVHLALTVLCKCLHNLIQRLSCLLWVLAHLLCAPYCCFALSILLSLLLFLWLHRILASHLFLYSSYTLPFVLVDPPKSCRLGLTWSDPSSCCSSDVLRTGSSSDPYYNIARQAS